MPKYCSTCGKEIDSQAKFCSYCGSKQTGLSSTEKNNFHPTKSDSSNSNQGQVNAQEIDIEKTNPFCIVGIVISGLSLFLNFDGIIGFVGFIISLIGYKQVKKTGENGKLLSIIGISIGAIASIIWLTALIRYQQVSYGLFNLLELLFYEIM